VAAGAFGFLTFIQAFDGPLCFPRVWSGIFCQTLMRKRHSFKSFFVSRFRCRFCLCCQIGSFGEINFAQRLHRGRLEGSHARNQGGCLATMGWHG
jgi:hypothetical protein